MIVVLVVLGVAVMVFLVCPCIGWIGTLFAGWFGSGVPDEHPFTCLYSEHFIYGVAISIGLGLAIGLGFFVKHVMGA